MLLFLCLYLNCFYFHGFFREGPRNLFFRLGNKMKVNVFFWGGSLLVGVDSSVRERDEGQFQSLEADHGWGWC